MEGRTMGEEDRGQEKEKKLSQADMKNRNRYEEREKVSQADMKNKKPI